MLALLVQQVVNPNYPLHPPMFKDPLHLFFYFFQPFPESSMRHPSLEKQVHFSYQVSGETIIPRSIQTESHL